MTAFEAIHLLVHVMYGMEGNKSSNVASLHFGVQKSMIRYQTGMQTLFRHSASSQTPSKRIHENVSWMITNV